MYGTLLLINLSVFLAPYPLENIEHRETYNSDFAKRNLITTLPPVSKAKDRFFPR